MDERAPAGRRITPFLIEDGYEVRLLLPDGETPYPAYELRGTAFVAGWRRNALSGLRTAGYCFCCRMAAKRLIRPTNCGVLLLLPDGGETPYPAYELRVLLLLPDGGENALSGLMANFCRPDKRSAIRQFTKPGQRED
ncbi:hypothetical protein ACR9H8_14695 [Kosakonia cowanii]